MSIINDRTGRHEDDLMAELHQSGGTVKLSSLLEHLQECVVEDVSGQPSTVRVPVQLAVLTLTALVDQGIIDKNADLTP